MANFLGVYNYTLDSKNRVNIPAKFRRELSPEADETFIIQRAPDKCLRAYPKDRWGVEEEKIAKLPETPGSFRYRRLMRDTLTKSKLDSQGRILLSENQIKVVGIKKNITLVGNNENIEIWSTEIYREYIEKEDDFDDVFFQSVDSGLCEK